MKNNAMPYLLVIVILVAFLALLFVALAIRGAPNAPTTVLPTTVPNTNGTNFVTISASGTVSNKSTEALVYVTINGSGPTNNQAVQNISATTKEFNSTIYPYINGNLSQISTSYFNVYKVYNRSVYTAEESITVTIPNINNVSAVIGALSAIPNLYLSAASTQLTNAQISIMRVQALKLAMANATQQAQAVIGNGKITATNITVNNYYFYPYRYALGTAIPASDSGYTTTVTIPPQFYGGTSQVTESVTVVFRYNSGST